MNRRLALSVPAAALMIGLGSFAAPVSAHTVPGSYTSNTPDAPDEGALDNSVTDDSGTGGTSGTSGTVTADSTGAGAGTGSGSLPFTGSESVLVLGLAAGALTTGVVLVGLGRRRANV